MEAVAAARLRKAEGRIAALRPYAQVTRSLTRRAAAEAGNVPQLAILDERKHVERLAILLITGDRGLAGAFNANIIREGLLIRDGVLSEPVREITIASTLQRLLLDIEAVGNDLEWLPMSAAGVTLVVGDVTMSGA